MPERRLPFPKSATFSRPIALAIPRQLAAGFFIEKLKKGVGLGLHIEGSVQLNPGQMVSRKNRVVAELVKGIGILI